MGEPDAKPEVDRPKGRRRSVAGAARIQILQVPGCPNVDRARETVRRALAQVDVAAEVEELVGDYPSPTVLVNGQDVTGVPPGAAVSCRLDLPTERQVLAALRTDNAGGGARAAAADENIRAAAFRRLLQAGVPIPVEGLAAELGQPLEAVQAAVTELGDRGLLRLDRHGDIIGSAGLSVGPDRHQIDIAGRRLWTWCAYDILGIFGALRASGTARSASPLRDEPFELPFVQGRPRRTDLVLFRPDESWRECCTNVYEEWCPYSNFFEGPEAAQAWAAGHGVTGRVLPLAEAATRATSDWRGIAGELRL